MQLQLTWINLLILFGALQGLIFCFILAFNKKHPGAKFLSIFMFVLAYNGLETFNWSAGLDKYYILFHIYPFVIIYAVGPSLYLYVRSVLFPNQPLPVKILLAHFAIVGFQFIIRTCDIALHFLEVYNFNTWISGHKIETVYWNYSEPLSILTFIIYLAATVRLFMKEKTRLPKETREVTLQWFHALLSCMVIMGIAWPATYIALFFTHWSDAVYYPIEIALVLFIYWIAFVGYHKTMLIYEHAKSRQNGVGPNEAEALLSSLRQIMKTQKLYLDPQLNLGKVSSSLNTTQKSISTILNQHQQMNFNDFINQYRVDEVKEKLLSSDFQHMTISGIALESGFNSQATFQRAFKNSTGLSPRQYISLEKDKHQRQTFV
jgi:AraC-like DNA-binding protein